MLKAIIIEDETHARSGLKKMINILEPSITIVGESGCVNEAIELINKENPTLIFMDIQLEDGTSFEILKHLEHLNFKIIFTTAYDEFALKAFKYSVIDYLLKPIDPLELKEAIKKALSNIKVKEQQDDLLRVLKANLETNNQKIVLKTSEQQHIVSVKDIIRLEANGAYTLFVTRTEKILISKNIKHYQEILEDNFIRCHQSHLVNLEHVLRLCKNNLLMMSNNDFVAISVRKKKSIIKAINNLNR